MIAEWDEEGAEDDEFQQFLDAAETLALAVRGMIESIGAGSRRSYLARSQPRLAPLTKATGRSQISTYTPSEWHRDRARTRRTLELIEASRPLSPEAEALATEQEHVDQEAVTNAEDHILRIAGQVCVEAGQIDLWKRIFAIAWGGDRAANGDEMDWLERARLSDSASLN